MDDHRGIGVEDLPAIYREGYLHAIESARAEHDPTEDWDRFREYLWHALIRAFGLEVDVPWPTNLSEGVRASEDSDGQAPGDVPASRRDGQLP